jgi:Family of unknown function (DUF6680)
MDPTSLKIAIVGLVLSTLTIVAIIYGPIAALRIQRQLDQESEKRERDRERKQFIFRTLWVTRSTPVNPRHVEALNMIDLDYRDCQPVVAAWNLYLDHLNTDATQPNWEERRVDSLTELLYQMSVTLGQPYDKVILKRHWYRPSLHWQIDDMDMALREGFFKIIKGQEAFRVRLVDVQPSQPSARAEHAGEKPELPPG